MMKGLSQVFHYPGETVIRIDCNQLGSIPNTNLGPLAMVALGHIWYNLGPFAGLTSATHSGTNQLPGRSGLPCPWPHIRLPTRTYYLLCAHSYRTTPGLS
jgi:hypothetical protein